MVIIYIRKTENLIDFVLYDLHQGTKFTSLQWSIIVNNNDIVANDISTDKGKWLFQCSDNFGVLHSSYILFSYCKYLYILL